MVARHDDNVIKQLDDNSFTWKTIERTAGGELLPNIDEVVIERAQSDGDPRGNPRLRSII